jgi:KaiC/GvpD/RAD55 family RecA-like ATPase
MPYRVPTALINKLESIAPAPKALPPEREGNPIRRLQDAKVLLNKLGAERVDDYESWLKVGMALKEFGIAGLALWKNWSKRSPKYEEGACENKWSGFADTPAVSLGSLAYWVKKDKPVSYFDGLFLPRGEGTEHMQTGLSSLDVALGELLRGEITTFAARSGFGKTTFSCTFAEHIRKTKRVLYFSTEMASSTIMAKMVALACNIPLARVIRRDFQPAEKKRIEEYQANFEAHPIIICDDFQPSIQKVRQEIADHHPDIVIFDHVSHISTSWEIVTQYMHELKTLAIEFNTVTLVLAMLGEPPRDKSGTNAQSLRSDVRGTQEIIYLSSIFMYVTNPYEVETDIQPVQIHVAKHRYGISGTVVETKVDKIISKFHE